MIIERIKTLLGLGDNLQDEVLKIIIESTRDHLRAMIGKDVPPELEFIIQEISIRRFNRLGSEGMKSESVEGHRIDFYDLREEFAPYTDIINAHREVDESDSGRGKVMFI